jgi:autotransporter-associated beta strand protein
VGTTGIFDVKNSFTIGDWTGAAGSFATLGSGNTLTFGTSNSALFDGMITGGGSLIKQGTGTATFSAANTYGGGTTINDGILTVTGSISGTVLVDNISTFDVQNTFTIGDWIGSPSSFAILGVGDTLTVGTANSTTFAGQISGLGSLAKQGTGTLYLSNTNTYSGGTFFNDGIISISSDANLGLPSGGLTFNGGTLQFTADVASNRSITINAGGGVLDTQSTTDILSGTISGSGTLTKIGTGTLVLTGISSFSGPTNINAGTLVVNGSNFSPTTVAAGASLKGTGVIGSSISAFGTVRPGNSVGTLTIAGPVIFNNSSTYAEEISPSVPSLLNVTAGSVTINPFSILSILPEDGSYGVGSTYTIIQASGGVIGTFTAVTNNFPLVMFNVIYHPQSVVLYVSRGNGSFTPLSPSGNGGKVAKCIDRATVIPGTDFATVLNQLVQITDLKTLQKALNQMQPSQFNAMQISQENITTRVFSVLSSRMEQIHRTCKPQEKTWDFWIDQFVDSFEQKHQNGEYGFHANTGALVVGADYQANPQIHLGFGGAYSWSHLTWGGHHGDGDITSGYGLLYGSWNFSHCFLDASFLAAYNSYGADRHIDFLAVDRHANSDYNGYTFAGSLAAGFPINVAKLVITPLLTLDYDFLHEQSFKEHGASSLNLHIQGKNSDLLRGELGFRATLNCEKCTTEWLPSFQLTAIREWRFRGKETRSSLQDLDCVSTFKGLNPDRTLISPAVGITWLGNGMSLTLDYVGEFAVDGKSWDQKGNLQFNYAF